MSPNSFGKCRLGPPEIQLHHKQQKMDRANCDNTAPPTPDLNAQLLQRQNGSLMSLMAQIYQGNMGVWFIFIVKMF